MELLLYPVELLQKSRSAFFFDQCWGELNRTRSS
jgi:hypothetical protein